MTGEFGVKRRRVLALTAAALASAAGCVHEDGEDEERMFQGEQMELQDAVEQTEETEGGEQPTLVSTVEVERARETNVDSDGVDEILEEAQEHVGVDADSVTSFTVIQTPVGEAMRFDGVDDADDSQEKVHVYDDHVVFGPEDLADELSENITYAADDVSEVLEALDGGVVTVAGTEPGGVDYGEAGFIMEVDGDRAEFEAVFVFESEEDAGDAEVGSEVSAQEVFGVETDELETSHEGHRVFVKTKADASEVDVHETAVLEMLGLRPPSEQPDVAETPHAEVHIQEFEDEIVTTLHDPLNTDKVEAVISSGDESISGYLWEEDDVVALEVEDDTGVIRTEGEAEGQGDIPLEDEVQVNIIGHLDGQEVILDLHEAELPLENT